MCVRSSQESPARHSFRQEIAARHNGLKRFLKEHSQGYRNNRCITLFIDKVAAILFIKEIKFPYFYQLTKPFGEMKVMVVAPQIFTP